MAVCLSKPVGRATVHGVEALVVLDVTGALSSRCAVRKGVAVDFEWPVAVARLGDLGGCDTAQSISCRGTAGAAATTAVVVVVLVASVVTCVVAGVVVSSVSVASVVIRSVVISSIVA